MSELFDKIAAENHAHKLELSRRKQKRFRERQKEQGKKLVRIYMTSTEEEVVRAIVRKMRGERGAR